MSIGSIGSSGINSASYQTGQPPKPRDITKSDLTQIKEKISESGGDVSGFDRLVENFDSAAGSSGKMSMAQFKSYAAEYGVDIPAPKPPSGGGAPMPPRGQGVESDTATETTSALTSAVSTTLSNVSTSVSANQVTSSSEVDVNTATVAELRQLAAQGNVEAIKKLAELEESGQTGSSTTSTRATLAGTGGQLNVAA